MVETLEMMLIKTAIYVLLFHIAGGIAGQNLLYNGSFENCFICPDEPGAIKYCEYWSIPNHSTPDLFKACQHKIPYYDIPYNVNGFQQARSGNTYIGMVIITAMSEYRDYREYIQGELKEELQANMLYKVTFYLSWAEYSNYFCDRIGYFFSPYKLTSNLNEPDPKKWKKKKKREPSSLNTILPASDGYVSLSLDSLKDRDSWHKVEFFHRAKGGEKYLILGLFGDNATEEDYQHYIGETYGRNYGKTWKGTYYYIDDVLVEKSEFVHH